MCLFLRTYRPMLVLLVAAGIVGPAKADELRRRGMLGVHLAPLPEPDRERLSLSGGAILVQGTVPGLPAEAAGLKNGDVVVRIGGEPFADLPAGLVAIARCDHNFDTAEDAEESFLAGFGGNFNNEVVEKTSAWIKARKQG